MEIPSHSYGVSLAVWDHTVFHPTQANTPRLYPSQTGWYSIYRPFKDGGLSKPRSRVQRATGPRLLLGSETAGNRTRARRTQVRRRNHYTTKPRLYIIMKARNGFPMTQRQVILKDECGYIMLENFIGQVFRTLS